MKFKKLISLATSGLLTVSVLAACGGTPSTSTPASSEASSTPETSSSAPAALEGKLTFSVWDLTTTTWYQPLADAFTAANPGVEIEFIDTPSSEYTDKLSTMLNGGTDFDVFFIKDADTSFSLNKKGQLEDLSDRISQDNVDLGIFNSLDKNFNFDGKQIALPVRTDYYVLFYNKDIFDAANEPYPTNDMTWTEFEEIAGRLTTGTGVDKQYGAFLHTWQACVGNWAVQDGKNNIMGPDYEYMRTAYEMALRMQDAGDLQEYATLKTANIHYSSAFQTGTCGMMPMGTWFASGMIGAVAKGESDVNWGIATLPHPDGLAAGNTVGSTTPMCINSASKNKDLAWEFVKFATGAEGAAVLSSLGQFPASTNDTHLKAITSVDGMPEGAADALQVSGIVLDRPVAEYVSEVNKMLGEEHDLVMMAQIDLDAFIKAIAERSAEIQKG